MKERLQKLLKIEKWPNPHQWSQFFKLLDKREIVVLIFLFCLFIGSVITLGIKFYLSNSVVVPAKGGAYTEGIIGNVRYFNPVLSENNESESDINSLLFSGLIKIDRKGNIVPDLAKEYSISEDGRIYQFTLKDGLVWHDKKPLTANDVLFTFKTIKDPIYKSPLLSTWKEVSIEQIDEKTIKFTINTPYAPLIYKFNVGIIPQHLWENIKPENFPLAELNTKPVGSGPYQFTEAEKTKSGAIKTVTLKANKNYYIREPYISKIVFKIYSSAESLQSALQTGLIAGTANIPIAKINNTHSQFNDYHLNLPRYFTIFFNQEQNKILSDINIRQALAMAIDKNQITNNILNDNASVINSPLPKNVFAFSEDKEFFPYNPDRAKQILEENGWTDKDNSGIRQKEETKLIISLTYIESEEFTKIAELIKSFWEAVGVEINLTGYNTGSIQTEAIRPRQFQTLLFGEVLDIIPDPFPFWHSSQKRNPGLNLSLFENKTVDQLLTEARQDLNEETRNQKLNQFGQIVSEKVGGIFLYSSDYIYTVNKKIKGIEASLLQKPSNRFNNITNWYIETERNLK